MLMDSGRGVKFDPETYSLLMSPSMNFSSFYGMWLSLTIYCISVGAGTVIDAVGFGANTLARMPWASHAIVVFAI